VPLSKPHNSRLPVGNLVDSNQIDFGNGGLDFSSKINTSLKIKSSSKKVQ